MKNFSKTNLRKIKGFSVAVPNARCAGKIRSAINFLEKADPALFKKTKKLLKVIFIVSRNNYANGVFEREGAWFASEKFLNTCPPSYLASLLIHEARHIAQFIAGQKYAAEKSEREAYLIQRKFLLKINRLDYVDWLDGQYNQKWWKKTARKNKSAGNFFRELADLKKVLNQKPR